MALADLYETHSAIKSSNLLRLATTDCYEFLHFIRLRQQLRSLLRVCRVVVAIREQAKTFQQPHRTSYLRLSSKKYELQNSRSHSIAADVLKRVSRPCWEPCQQMSLIDMFAKLRHVLIRTRGALFAARATNMTRLVRITKFDVSGRKIAVETIRTS